MKPKIIFSIVNYNTEAVLDNCLESIKKTQKKHEVFVVDNASTDGSVEMVGKKYPEVKLVQNKKNIGFGSAHNIVLKKAHYDFAVITNSDIIFLDEIERTISVLLENKRIGACSIKLLNKDKSIQKNVYPMPTLKNEIITRLPFFKDPYSGFKFDYEKSSKVDCFNGACFIVKKDAVEEAGFFDEDFFAYAEETELFFRMQKKGWLVYYCPNTTATHLGGQTTKEKDKRYLMYFSSLLKFFRKSHGRKKELCLRTAAVASSVVELSKGLILSVLDKKHLKEIIFSIEIIKISLGIKE